MNLNTSHFALTAVRRAAIAAAALAALPAVGLAHGPQIQVTNDGGKITTRRLFLDGPYGEQATPTPKTTVYVLPLGPSGGELHSRPNPQVDAGTGLPTFDSGPGIAYGNGWSYTSAASYVTTFPVGSAFSLSFADGLKQWNGSAFVDPGAAQLQMYRGGASAPTASATTVDGGPSAAMAFSAVAAPTAPNPEPHSSASYRLLGDGVSPSSQISSGIYVATLQLANTVPGIANSDPFQFVMYTPDVSPSTVDGLLSSQFAAQLAAGQVQVVPEPGTAGLLAAGAAAGLLARRRRPGRRGPIG